MRVHLREHYSLPELLGQGTEYEMMVNGEFKFRDRIERSVVYIAEAVENRKYMPYIAALEKEQRRNEQ